MRIKLYFHQPSSSNRCYLLWLSNISSSLSKKPGSSSLFVHSIQKITDISITCSTQHFRALLLTFNERDFITKDTFRFLQFFTLSLYMCVCACVLLSLWLNMNVMHTILYNHIILYFVKMYFQYHICTCKCTRILRTIKNLIFMYIIRDCGIEEYLLHNPSFFTWTLG